MPYLTQVEVIKWLTSLCFESYGSTTELYVVRETSSFYLQLTGPLATPVVYLHSASLLGALTPVSIIFVFQWDFHSSGRYGYWAACTPRQEILIGQLCYGKLLLFGSSSSMGFQVLCGALSWRHVAIASGLPLPVVPPAMELSLRPLLWWLSQSKVLCEPFP